MPRLFFLCPVLLVALALPATAAAPTFEDAPVPASIRAFAESIGVTSDTPPPQFVAEMARLIYAEPDVKHAQVVAALAARTPDDRPPAGNPAVPVPLAADVWSRAIFRRPVAPRDLISAILIDRRAALLCHGLAGLDDETLNFLADHPAVLSDLYDRAAPAFAAFGASLRIRANHIISPGAEAGVPLWESAVGESVARPERFVRALFADNDGRLAYLYDTVADLDAPHAAFALGTWITDAGVRDERFKALAAASIHGYHEWHLAERPFTRPVNDFAIAMARLRVEPSGMPGAPAERALWNGVFDLGDASDASRDRAERGLFDAAFLAEATSGGDMYARSDRVDQLAFAQRVFADTPAASRRDVTAALKALPRQRMLMFALERLGVRTPSVYATASARARDITAGDPNRVFWTIAQFQGSLALVARAHRVGTIDSKAAERLVVSLCAVPLIDDKYQGAVARWIERDLVPAMPAAPGPEARLIAGLSGRENDPAAPRLVWEGQPYRLDFAAAEARRLRAVRDKQAGYSIDAALDLADLAAGPDARRAGPTTANSLATLAGRFTAPPKGPRLETADMMAPGVAAPTSAREQIDRTVVELAKVDESREPGRTARIVSPLVDTADVALAEALLSLVYAVDIGSPDGPALLASNVALRHDFGFGLQNGEQRARRPWDVPRQDFLPDVPWHVTGSLLGLDIALAPLTLRHINLDRLADAPHLTSIEREEFAVGAALMNPRLLRDADRDAIVAAIARGRERVVSAASNAADIETLENAIGLDGWRRRNLQWALQHEHADVSSMFSLAELLTLGGGAPEADVDAWGTSALSSSGCACTRLVTPAAWRLLAGRAQVAFMSFVAPDLNLRVAAVLSELHLPAALERPVLAAAVQDFIDEVGPADASDWWTLSRSAQTLSRQRIEDYVAAAAAIDGPLVPVDAAGPVSVP